ncbi:TPA: flagellar protein FlaG [Pseudomonas aeruginosa]|uniref:flagellar protein FlaG n=1 Tax=Pseudomonas aeruginosa TaxID=287 RepID=UPI000F83C8AD|nr:flagellar protein FlaG [Pseudomonas aeruginosa]MBI8156755.1 flagellar protein FlaG [Pseudomonas aeruginosa]RTS98146.1 flagellar protein FlaG [Pseudomonas aeruginosa]HCK3377519.1 flagellar protein FlaG [Pseudomonas aeruginosa]
MDVGNITSLSTFKTGRAPEASGDIFAPRSAADGSGKPLPEVTASREASESRYDLGLAVSDIQSFVQSVKRNLNFSIDDSSGQVVVKVIDGDSGEVVRQIPSEEVLKLAARLDDVRSVLFETRA